tara:strand:+ start:1320 stop:1520 length:201 start_codon:yes stop_codon:yes gene_type:complete
VSLWAILGIILAALGGAGGVFFAGRRNGQAADMKATLDADERIADAIGSAPASRDELVDRLRKAGL